MVEYYVQVRADDATSWIGPYDYATALDTYFRLRDINPPEVEVVILEDTRLTNS